MIAPWTIGHLFFSIADKIGGKWPEKVELSFKALTKTDDDDDSIGPMLLNDIREIFNDKRQSKIFSDNLVDALINMEERPWAEWKVGKPITQNSLARLLKPFGIKSADIRIGAIQRKGYQENMFKDAFSRYLASSSPQSSFQTVKTRQATDDAGYSRDQGATKNDRVSDQKTRQATAGEGCRGVADENTLSATIKCKKAEIGENDIGVFE